MKSIIEKSFETILAALEENPEREGLLKTPHRAAKALEFLTQGYHQDIEKIINNATFSCNTNEMVIIKDIELYSLCEHHLLPFFGKCHVAYLPHKKVLGLSKVARIVDLFSRRLQIQEQLTKEIADCILQATQALGVGIVIEAKHFCMMMRGVQKQNSSMITSVMLGSFREDHRTRAEFLNLISRM
ncbi:MAG: hypothetical protein ACD_44C00066G0005 [uncultured bacterium]|nr:MAG: hypothetical protein ACD_44C00066G0005 [uncultured bacterium]OGT16818.1 MAG: GTP cyclohydrolase I FolE [Gammaproteobacteria bacterium RIFCSPHIGHO2_02_FULL_38_33]OGT24778.1 MAG: GTP cyclohydrolase I FolE [Gammaproteobacteria bacterium RIFCSPHIGHO2_12_38_15]OGT67471.1 MAG: GTP cyclohydrolase I FolE [Gammaproteobacteria bacterium RIFCSPLOWO2_02_FULL_38_11]OGT76175.1 MAG: GTP cyclohydrolase I FolE [Gammaproteobacteria bacterium RIFCSPLOWO2_12_FULL_38_14]